MPATEQATASPTEAMSTWMDGFTPLLNEAPPTETKETPEDPNHGGTKTDPAAAPGPRSDAAVDANGEAGRAAAAAAAAAKSAAEPVKPATEVAPEEDKWPRSAKDWEKFRAARKETETKLQSEVAQRETQISELQAQLSQVRDQLAKPPAENPQVKTQLDQLKKENDEMSRRLQVLDVTQHPKFQTYFQNKTNAQISLAKRIVGEELAKDVEAALALPETPEFKEIKENRLASVLENLTPLQQSRIGSVLNALSDIDREREEEIALAKDNSARVKALDQEKAESSKRQLTQTTEAALGEAVKHLQDPKTGSPLFQLREGDEAWNNAVKSRIELARNLFYGTDKLGLKDYVSAALSAASYPEVLASYRNYVQSSKAELAKLSEQVKALTAAQPRRGASVTEPGAEGAEGKLKLNREMSPMDVTQAWLKSGPWGE